MIALLLKKKESVVRLGHPVGINKGKLIDELIAEVEALKPPTPTAVQTIVVVDSLAQVTFNKLQRELERVVSESPVVLQCPLSGVPELNIDSLWELLDAVRSPPP